jgi:hypothetical protein
LWWDSANCKSGVCTNWGRIILKEFLGDVGKNNGYFLVAKVVQTFGLEKRPTGTVSLLLEEEK